MAIRLSFIYISIVSVIFLLIINFLRLRRKKQGKYSSQEDEKSFWYKFMHFFCGFFTAMFLSSFFRNSLLIVGLTFFVGIIWEIGEYIFGLYKLKEIGTSDYLTKTRDTIGDLTLDTLGAVAWIGLLIYTIYA